jgi:hypothetical protein
MLMGCYLYGMSLLPLVGLTACARRVKIDTKDKYESL